MTAHRDKQPASYGSLTRKDTIAVQMVSITQVLELVTEPVKLAIIGLRRPQRTHPTWAIGLSFLVGCPGLTEMRRVFAEGLRPYPR